MNRIRKPLQAALLAGLFLIACKKKDERGLTEGSFQLAHLTAGSWVFKTAGVDLDQDGTIDAQLVPGTLKDCLLDNEYIFQPDGNGIQVDSLNRCDTAIAPRAPFNWHFSDNEQRLNVSGNALFGLSGKLRIWELNDTLLTIARDTVIAVPFIPTPVNASLLLQLKHY